MKLKERQECSPGAVIQPGSPGNKNAGGASLQMQQRSKCAKWASVSRPYGPPKLAPCVNL